MNYEILRLNLTFPDWKNWYGGNVFVAEREVPSPAINVGEDYASGESFGLYVDDDELAYQHALCMAERIRRKNQPKARYWLYFNRFYKDIINYLHVSELMSAGTREHAEFLLRYAATYNLKEKLADIVCRYWEDYCESGALYALDFDELYMACGDKMLFEKRDIEAAVRFYELAALDWETDEDERGRSLKRKREIPELADLRAIAAEKMLSSKKEDVREEEYGCRELYAAFIGQRAENPGAYDRLLDYADRFCAAYRQFIDAWEGRQKENVRQEMRGSVRRCYSMALVMKRMGLPYALFFLADEGEAIQTDYRDAVWRGLYETTRENLFPIRKYVRSVKNEEQIPYETLLDLAKCAGVTELISFLLLEEDTEQELAYYTSIETFRFLLPEHAGEECGKLSVMHMAYMNDPNEGKTLQRFVCRKDAEDGERSRKSVRNPYVFMKCFTSLIDDLPMWEMYGNHAKGCCVILDKDCLEDNEQLAKIPLYRVCYLKKSRGGYRATKEANPHIEDWRSLSAYLKLLQQFYDRLRSNPAALQIYFQILDAITFLFKDADYQHEQELRILYSYGWASDDFRHTPGEFPKLYLQPDFYIWIKELILGPKVENIAEKMPYLQEQIEKMCDEVGVLMPEITVSEIQYR